MADDGRGPPSSGTVAQRLVMAASALGPARAKLIATGLIYSPEHRFIAFTVPGMAEFVLASPPTSEPSRGQLAASVRARSLTALDRSGICPSRKPLTARSHFRDRSLAKR